MVNKTQITVLLTLFFSFGLNSPGAFCQEDFFKTQMVSSSASQVNITIYPNDTITKVSKYIYGNNSNIYMGQMVNEPELIHYIKLLNPSLIRYPGGNLSNLFFFNATPQELPEDAPRPLYGGVEVRYKENYWFGNDNDSSTLSVDNYYKMLEMVNSEGIICVNYSYARYGLSDNPVVKAAHLAAEWIRYDNGRTTFWEIGNENYGHWQAGFNIDTINNKDGQPQFITGEIYGKHFKVFADSMRKAAADINHTIKIGAVIFEDDDPERSEIEKNWNNGFFKHAGNDADFFIVHTYYTKYLENSGISTILNSAIPKTKQMVDYVKNSCVINGVELKPMALTEWNIFAVSRKQQCSYINGIHSAIVLGELIKNNYYIACRWNFANGYENGDDHGMFSQGDEPGVPKWNPRPVFFYMYYFQKTFGDYLINSEVKGNNDIICYSSVNNSNKIGIVLINKNEKPQNASISFSNTTSEKKYKLFSLTGGEDNGDFSQQVFINKIPPSNKTGGPINEIENIKPITGEFSNNIELDLPGYSVSFLSIDY